MWHECKGSLTSAALTTGSCHTGEEGHGTGLCCAHPKGNLLGYDSSPLEKIVGYTNCSIYLNLNGWWVWCCVQVSVEHALTWAASPRSWCTRQPCSPRPCRTRASSAGSLTRQVRGQSTDRGGREGGTSHRLALVNQRQALWYVACHSCDSADGRSECTQWSTTGRPWKRRWTTTSARWTGATG